MNLFQTARRRLLRMHFEAKVGHLGGNLSCIDALMTLFHEVKTPQDCVLLSKGHAVGALYVTLWSLGVLSEEQLGTFYKNGTHLAAHPPARWIPEIPFATGSLGHGLSLSAGLALGKKLKGEAGRIFCMTSDGEWQEGSTWEALIFLSHHQLSNLTVLIDLNGLQGFGTTQEVASMQDLERKLASFPVEVVSCSGHDPVAMKKEFQIQSACPRVVVLQTVKGKGVSFMENRMDWHYLPLTPEQYQQAVQELEKVV